MNGPIICAASATTAWRAILRMFRPSLVLPGRVIVVPALYSFQQFGPLDPSDADMFYFDWSAKMPGIPIATATVVAIPASGATVGPVNISGSVVQVLISGDGPPGESVGLRCTSLFVSGRQLSFTGSLYIEPL